jgi:putative membrane protein
VNAAKLGWLVGLWICNVAALWVADALLDGLTIADTSDLLIGAAVLTLVNWLVKPLMTLLALPFIVVTLGLAYLLVCAGMLALMEWVTSGVQISGWSFVWAAVIVGAVNMVLQPLFGVGGPPTRRAPGPAA